MSLVAFARLFSSSAVGALSLALALTHPASADELGLACAQGQSLSVEEQSGLMQASDSFRLLYMAANDIPASAQMRIETPGAFQGDGFPPNLCFARVTLTLEKQTLTGRVKYVPPDPKAEHKGWPFQINFAVGQPAELIFFDMPNGLNLFGAMIDASGRQRPFAGWSLAREN